MKCVDAAVLFSHFHERCLLFIYCISHLSSYNIQIGSISQRVVESPCGYCHLRRVWRPNNFFRGQVKKNARQRVFCLTPVLVSETSDVMSCVFSQFPTFFSAFLVRFTSFTAIPISNIAACNCTLDTLSNADLKSVNK